MRLETRGQREIHSRAKLQEGCALFPRDNAVYRCISTGRFDVVASQVIASPHASTGASRVFGLGIVCWRGERDGGKSEGRGV